VFKKFHKLLGEDLSEQTKTSIQSRFIEIARKCRKEIDPFFDKIEDDITKLDNTEIKNLFLNIKDLKC